MSIIFWKKGFLELGNKIWSQSFLVAEGNLWQWIVNQVSWHFTMHSRCHYHHPLVIVAMLGRTLVKWLVVWTHSWPLPQHKAVNSTRIIPKGIKVLCLWRCVVRCFILFSIEAEPKPVLEKRGAMVTLINSSLDIILENKSQKQQIQWLVDIKKDERRELGDGFQVARDYVTCPMTPILRRMSLF